MAKIRLTHEKFIACVEHVRANPSKFEGIGYASAASLLASAVGFDVAPSSAKRVCDLVGINVSSHGRKIDPFAAILESQLDFDSRLSALEAKFNHLNNQRFFVSGGENVNTGLINMSRVLGEMGV